MKYIYMYIAIIVSAFTISCSEIPNKYNAEKLTLEEIPNLPGFGWYNSEFANYRVLQEDINFMYQLDNFNPETDQILLFVQPTAACEGEQRGFPVVAKTIIEAGFKDRMVLFVTPDKNSRHPYMEDITLPKIPYYHILRNGEPFHELRFTFGNRPTQFSSIHIE